VENTLRGRIEQALANDIGPALDMDGTRIEIVDLQQDGSVQLRLNGVCGGCPSSIMAAVMGIEQELQRLVPEIPYIEIVP